MAKKIEGFVCVKCNHFAVSDFNICAKCGWNHKNSKYMGEAIDICSNCHERLTSPEELDIVMCDSCLEFMSKITTGGECRRFLICHVCGQRRNLLNFGKVTSVEDCICDFCNNGVEYGQ